MRFSSLWPPVLILYFNTLHNFPYTFRKVLTDPACLQFSRFLEKNADGTFDSGQAREEPKIYSSFVGLELLAHKNVYLLTWQST